MKPQRLRVTERHRDLITLRDAERPIWRPTAEQLDKIEKTLFLEEGFSKAPSNIWLMRIF
jgi:hypothetical protein